MPRVAAGKLLLSLLTGEAHWGPAGWIAGKVLGVCVGGTFTQFLSHGSPSQQSTGRGGRDRLVWPLNLGLGWELALIW